MIIDDDKEFLEELKELLQAPNYDIVTQDNSVEALSDIKRTIPDLILLDIKMQELNGIQLAALINLSAETKKIPLILISGNVNHEEIREAMKICNIQRYFEKPVDPHELIAEVRSVLSSAKKA